MASLERARDRLLLVGHGEMGQPLPRLANLTESAVGIDRGGRTRMPRDSPAPLQAFTPTVDDAVVQDLLNRLAASRFPPSLSIDDWSAGTPVPFVRDLVQAWSTDFDFDAYRARLSALPHFKVLVDGVWTHFIHARSPHRDATPLVITHGWPSSFLEIVPMLSWLTRPEEHGRPPEDAFHVVIPSMPGFAFSDPAPTIRSLTAASIADRWRTLMSRLGYGSFVASGGDIGARVTAWLAVRHPDAVLGAHLSTNALCSAFTAGLHDSPPLSHEEQAWLTKMAKWSAAEGAYHHLQSTKPMTAALALSDSPVAMAGWVAEKWQSWGALDLETEAARTTLLSLLTLFWTTGSLGSSVFHYGAHGLPPGPRPVHHAGIPPISMYASALEIGGVPPRSLADRQYPGLRWRVLPRGGHFMAAEEPDLLAADLCQFRNELS